ncbi:MAG: hypothetical protein IKQ92_03650 [Clostridia bacterium]|nr:hypothetical protein [Clostridia bacterium]
MVSLKKHGYALEIEDGKIGVILDGCEVAGLDVRSAVHVLGDDGKPVRDEEPALPVLADMKTEGAVTTFVWKNKSSLWEEKTYTLVCDPLRFRYYVKVRGKGRADTVEYFTGNAAEAGHGSAYEFEYGFNPCKSWYNKEDYWFKASTPCHRWSVLMVPPMFCYSFRCPALSRQLALGLVAEKGEHNFNSFDYTPTTRAWKSAFYLSTDPFGHVRIDGEWTAPSIVGFGAQDEYDAMQQYARFYFVSGIAETKKKAVPPKFWHGPMACGWIEQFADNGLPYRGPDAAREVVYEEYLKRLRAAGLYPRCLIIDDKWQGQYCSDVADENKWSDLRAFVDRRHAEGVHTMLWFKVFDPEGLDDAATVTTEAGEKRVDPSHPIFLKMLDEALTRIFSPDKGCYDCDGIKIDYAFQIPIGRDFKTYSGKYGVELLYDFMKHIYDTVKAIKPDAIVNCSPCHPYFAHLCDQARLHDYNPDNRDCREDLEMRAKMYRIAMPDTLIDTDNAGFNTRRDTMRWMLDQPSSGVPDIYCVSPIPGGFAFEREDLEALSAVWREYTELIDAAYGERV